jgi:hypothetical protein
VVESLLKGGSEKSDGKDAGVEGSDKGAAEAKPGESKPIAVEDLVVPEGKSWDEESSGKFFSLINDASLSKKEFVQKLVDLAGEQQDRLVEGYKTANEVRLAKERQEEAEWLEMCKKDSEFGGQKYEESKAIIDRGCARLATPEAVEILNDLGMGTHPEIVRMFYRAGKLLGEDPGANGKVGAVQSPAPGEGLYKVMKQSLEGVVV